MHKKTQLIIFTALMAAMITLFTSYVCHIPIGASGGYIHFGDSLIYLAACFLPLPYAMAAAAIGGGLADVLTSPLWAPFTIVIKALICIPFTHKGTKFITTRNILASVIAFGISGIGYALAEAILTSTGFWLVLPVSLPGSAVQSIGSAILFLAFGHVLDRMNCKQVFLSGR